VIQQKWLIWSHPPSLLQDKRANIVTRGLVVLDMGSITKRKCSRSPASAHPSSHIGIIISQKSSLNKWGCSDKAQINFLWKLNSVTIKSAAITLVSRSQPWKWNKAMNQSCKT
jgi:hypothetical protein